MFEILIVLGTISSIGMALSPISAMMSIFNSKSVGSFTIFPYISTLCQCVLWITYAAIAEGKRGLYPSNILVGTIEAIYCVIFIKYAGERLSQLIIIITLSLASLTGTIVMSFYFTSKPSDWIGLFASVSNLLMYAAPLAIVKTVVETKSDENMPFFLSLVGTIASIVWTAWGVSVNDIFVLIPNAIGIALGLAQLAVYYKYRHGNKTKITVEPDEAATVETSPLIR